MKHSITALLLVCLWLTACTQNLNTLKLNDWQDSLSCEAIATDIRIGIACDQLLHCESDDQYDSLMDTIAVLLLTPDMLDKEQCETYPLRFAHADDKRAMLMTIVGLGRYCTGTSFVLYKKTDCTCTVKKVAYSVPSKHGGPTLPAQFHSIKKVENGYDLHGKFSFNDSPESFLDTMHISKDFLESSEFIREYEYDLDSDDEEPIFVTPKN